MSDDDNLPHDPATCRRNLAGLACRLCGQVRGADRRAPSPLGDAEIQALARAIWAIRPDVEADIDPPVGRLPCDRRYSADLVYGGPDQCEHGVTRAVPTRCALCRRAARVMPMR